MFRFAVMFMVVMLSLPSLVSARTITDMHGRKVTIPDRIERVATLSPPATYLLYMIDPALMIGLNCPVWEHEKKYTSERFQKLPVIGGMAGTSRTLNMEVLLRAKPDIAILWELNNGEIEALNRKYMGALAKAGIPAVVIHIEKLEDYPNAIRFMGDVLNRKERAARLGRYTVSVIRNVKRKMAGLPESKRVSVYYAEGVDGLATEGESSTHARLISLSGGRNVCRVKPSGIMGEERITMEQLLLYNPDVILVREKVCFNRIRNDSRWNRLRAVRDRRVYLIPNAPFNWFDRPPSLMQVLGAQWLANLLHPDRYPMDMVKETKAFYRLFLGRELTDREARDVLWPGRL